MRSLLLCLAALFTLISAQIVEIVGGANVSATSFFPYIVSIHLKKAPGGFDKDIHLCGGSILNTSAILTAAHCCHGNTIHPATSLGIRYGTVDLDSGGATTNVTRVIIHHNYSPQTLDHDFCMLQVDPMDFSIGPSSPVPVSHHGSEFYDNKTIVVAGWGLTNGNATETPTVLKGAILQGLARETCQSLWAPILITKAMMCAAPYVYGNLVDSACRGDSGGPLVDETGKNLIGVVSFGSSDCTITPRPNVFGNVHDVRDWIHTHSV